MKRNEEHKDLIKNLLVFPLNDQLYALDVAVVDELIPLPEITPLGNMPSYIKGVIDLRGTIVPIIDLKIRLGLHSRPYELDDAVIIVKVSNLIAGLIVDPGSFVLELPSSALSRSPEMIAGNAQHYFSGWGHAEKGLFILLDLEKLLDRSECETLQKITAPTS